MTESENKYQFNLKSSSRPFSRAPLFCIGSGRAALGLRDDYRKQLKFIRSSLGFDYIRFHGLLCDDMDVVKRTEAGLNYKFDLIDSLFDFLLQIGIRPFVELSFMPYALASGPETIFWWKGNVTLPKEMNEWKHLISELTQHWLKRYGERELSRWYFEVWNEPDLPQFFKGTQTDYFSFYRATVESIKAIAPFARVGGPATSEHRWIAKFLNYCDVTSTPLDFISSHGYCVDGMLDESGNRSLYLPQSESNFVRGVKETKAQVLSSKFPNLEVHYTEWSASFSSRDPIHDHYFSCAFLLSRIFELRHTVQSLSYWTFSDIFEELGPANETFHGGFGVLTIDSICKPTYFLFKYLAKLRSSELEGSREGIWITKDQDSIAGLLWYERELPASMPNKVLFRKLLPPEKKKNIEVTLDAISPGKYLFKLYRVGFERNDAYSEYLKSNAKGMASHELKEKLSTLTQDMPERTEDIIIDPSGSYTFSIELRQGDVALFEVEIA